MKRPSLAGYQAPYDSERLLDLLFEHRIGVQERSATLFEVDEAFFDAPIDEGSDLESKL